MTLGRSRELASASMGVSYPSWGSSRASSSPAAPLMASFDGRTVVVTGAASGIGLEVTRRFLAAGASVVAGDLAPEGVPEGAVAIRMDVTSEADVEGLVSTALERTGRIDVMCNNAGIGSTSD